MNYEPIKQRNMFCRLYLTFTSLFLDLVEDGLWRRISEREIGRDSEEYRRAPVVDFTGVSY